MSLVLQYRLANQAWQQIPLLEGDLLIGRGSGSSLRLTGRGVSRRHAEIRRRGDQLWIADLGSTNGTLLNGQRLKRDTPQALHAGQTIRIGDYSLAVVASPHAAPVPTPMARPASGHIFISYSRHDTQLVYPLVDKLEKLGFRVWIDKQDIKPGRPWRGQIVQAIAEADALVLMVSPNSVASTNVQKEIDLASDDKIMILPVILQPAKYPDGLKFQLIDLQYIDLFSNPEHGYSQLVQALRERQRILAQQPPRVRPRDIRAELLLPGARVSDFYREKQEQLLKFLAQTTNISPRELSIVELTAGSVRVVVNMPATAAYELKAQALNGNPALLAAGIASLRLAGDKAFIAIGGGPPPAAGTAGQAPGGPPAAPAAGGLKSMLWVAGAFAATIAVIVGVYALTNGERPAVVPPPITVTHTPTFTRPPLTRTPTATRTRTPTPTITRTRTPTPTRPSLTPTIPSRTPDIQVGIPEPIGPSGWELFVCSASSTTISLVWTEVFDPSQPVTYEWELSRYTGSGYAIYDSGITRETSVDVTVECFEDDYSWRVRAIDGAGNEGVFSPYANFSANEDYSVDIPQTYAPYNWETITCNDITADVTFEWQEVEDISQPVWYQWETYQHDIQCPVDEGECWDVYYYLDNGTTGDTTATVEFSCFPEELAWRVQAIDGLENQSAFSAYTHFEVQPFVAVPQPISPVDTSISCYYSTISITLTWSGIFDPNEPVLYEWQLEFYDSYYGYSYYDAGSTYNTSATLSVSCGLDFRWRVRAQDSLGNTSEYSNSVEFSVVHTVD